MHTCPDNEALLQLSHVYKSECALLDSQQLLCGYSTIVINIKQMQLLSDYEGKTAFVIVFRRWQSAAILGVKNLKLFLKTTIMHLHVLAFLLTLIVITWCVSTGTAMTPRWCTSWVRWSHGTLHTTLRGEKWRVAPHRPTCTRCTPITCFCGGSCTPDLCYRYCRKHTGTPLSTAAL